MKGSILKLLLDHPSTSVSRMRGLLMPSPDEQASDRQCSPAPTFLRAGQAGSDFCDLRAIQ
jgi:hypothetical protein